MKLTRRLFLKASLLYYLMISVLPWMRPKAYAQNKIEGSKPKRIYNSKNYNLGVGINSLSQVYLVQNGSPEDNLAKAIEMMGGIDKIVGHNDIVVLKPNAQRFNQGMTNTDAMKSFIDLALSIPGFSGEIIIAENHQYNKDDCCGWTTKNRNGRYNLYELVEHYQNNGHPNVSKYHWHVAGPCTYPLEGNGQGNSRVTGPEDGDGYVWMENEYYLSPTGRKCLMTYPVFTSTYSGITVDFYRGAWKGGHYLTDRKIRFINFSALNHHGRYCGATASVKNLMGVVDMTCGFPGDFYPETYNTHHIGVSRLKHWLYHGHWRIRDYRGWLRYRFEDYCYKNFHHTGGALGYFMAHVRMPDLNIITAELVGWGDRKQLDMAFRPKAVLMSTDPVALDYIATKDILLPGTPMEANEVSGLSLNQLNNPDNTKGPLYRFLRETYRQGIGNLEKDKIIVNSFNFYKDI